MPDSSVALVDHLFRKEAGRLVGRLVCVLGFEQVEVAEDAVQDALIAALRSWPQTGVPSNPQGWLFTVARNRAIDHCRRISRLRDRLPGIAAIAVPTETDFGVFGLDAEPRLKLLFVCCHPALAPENAVALSLKLACGFGTREIAGAFGLSEATVSQRIYRAKLTLRRCPAEEVSEVLDPERRVIAVIAVLYLLFSEGYNSHFHPGMIQHELLEEAIELAGTMCGMDGLDSPVLHALLAIMYFHGSRVPARSREYFVPYLDQDRSRWNLEWIAKGVFHFRLAMAGADNTRYHMEAAIAASYCEPVAGGEPDWERILGLYDELTQLVRSPFMELDRVLVLARVRGPAEALRVLSSPGLADSLDGYMLFHAARAYLYSQTKDNPNAIAALERAVALPTSGAEEKLLHERLEAARQAGGG